MADAVLAAHERHALESADGTEEVATLAATEASLVGEYANLREALRSTRDADLRTDLISDAGVVRAKLEKIRFELHGARARQGAALGAGDGVRRTIAEAARIIGDWWSASTDERQALFDQWVEDVLVEIEHEPGRRWPTHRRAVICLATLPNQVHRRRRGNDTDAEILETIKRRKQLARGALNCGESVASPRCRSRPAQRCPRG
jgi:hypothetical protein